MIREFWESAAAKELSHYRGVGRWRDDEAWRDIGKNTFGILDMWLSRYHRYYKALKMAEFGCGAGSESLELCRHFGQVYGIDISKPNLNECWLQVRSDNFVPVLIPEDEPEAALSIGQVDVFLSVSVYQHFPRKEWGARVTRIAYSMLGDGGFAFIQTRYDDGDPIYMCKTSDYEKNVVTFTSYKSEEFRQIAERIGFQVIGTVRNPGNHYQYWMLRK